ncbi:MAG: AMP-binding protein, partial [Microbispora sp.]|nr:AMP-binding protein [Microbispora sp.]
MVLDFAYPLRVACGRYARRRAIVHRRGELTYAELGDRVERLASGFRSLGLGGRRVASLLLNEPETVEVYMALAAAGAISVPVNVRLTVDEKAYILEDSGASVLIVDPEHAGEAQALAARVPAIEHVVCTGATGGGDALELAAIPREGAPGEPESWVEDDETPATIMYTSGTTGFPKGVVRSHRANVWNVVNSALGSPRTPDDVELFNLPAFGIGFLHFAMPALLGGATLVLDRAFDAERVWELLERERVTRTFLAPTMIAAMLRVDGNERYGLEALRIIYSAYEFSPALRQRALARFGDRFIYMYGLTEAQLTCGSLGEFAAIPTSVGRGMGLLRIRILGPGGSPAPDG